MELRTSKAGITVLVFKGNIIRIWIQDWVKVNPQELYDKVIASHDSPEIDVIDIGGSL